jgi:hypothetical protein
MSFLSLMLPLTPGPTVNALRPLHERNVREEPFPAATNVIRNERFAGLKSDYVVGLLPSPNLSMASWVIGGT